MTSEQRPPKIRDTAPMARYVGPRCSLRSLWCGFYSVAPVLVRVAMPSNHPSPPVR